MVLLISEILIVPVSASLFQKQGNLLIKNTAPDRIIDLLGVD